MPIHAKLHNGTILQFPDDTPDDVVDRVVKQTLADLNKISEVPERDLGNIGGDILTSAEKGGIGAVQSLVGLADIPSMGAAGRELQKYLDLNKIQSDLSNEYSPAQQQAIKNVRDAEGFTGKIAAYAANPSAALSDVGESIPTMLAGGAAAKGLNAITKMGSIIAGAAGEGLVTAGSTAENLRAQNPDQWMTGKDELAALGTGVGATVAGVLGGKLADKFGIANIHTMMAGESAAPEHLTEIATQGFFNKAKQVLGGGFTEGVFEEMPQSVQEQMWSNYAKDRPIMEGVPESAAAGLVTGGLMGGMGGAYAITQSPPTTAAPPLPGAGQEDFKTDQERQVDAWLADREKSAMISNWLGGATRGSLHNELMQQDLNTHAGLDRAEQLMGGDAPSLGTRGLSIFEEDLKRKRDEIGPRPSEQPEPTGESHAETPLNNEVPEVPKPDDVAGRQSMGQGQATGQPVVSVPTPAEISTGQPPLGTVPTSEQQGQPPQNPPVAGLQTQVPVQRPAEPTPPPVTPKGDQEHVSQRDIKQPLHEAPRELAAEEQATGPQGAEPQAEENPSGQPEPPTQPPVDTTRAQAPDAGQGEILQQQPVEKPQTTIPKAPVEYLEPGKIYKNPQQVRADLEKNMNAALGRKGFENALKDNPNIVRQAFDQHIMQNREGANQPPHPPNQTSVTDTGALRPNKGKWTKILNYIETKLFSDEAALTNDIRASMEKTGYVWKQIEPAIRASNKSQAVHAGTVGVVGVEMGSIDFNDPTGYYKGVMKAETIKSIINTTNKIAAEKGMSEAEGQVALHDFMEARRVKGIHDAADKALAEIEKTTAEQSKAVAKKFADKYKHILDLSNREAASHMTAVECDEIIKRTEDAGLADLFLAKDGPIDMWQGVRKNTAEAMVASGRWSRIQANDLLAVAEYVPFFRVMEQENVDDFMDTVVSQASQGLLSNRREHRMKGSGRQVQNIFKNMEQWQAMSFALAVKNHKATKMVDTALKYLPKGDCQFIETKDKQPGDIMIYRHGQKEYYRFADPLYSKAFIGLHPLKAGWMRQAAVMGNFLRRFVVLNPLFTIGQLPQDTYAAMYSSGLKHPFKLPLEVARQFYKTLRGTTPEREALRPYATVGNLEFSNQVLTREMDILIGLREPPKGVIDNFKRKMEQFSSIGDNAIRQAVYKRTIKELGDTPEARAKAIDRAFDIINFRRRGASATSDAIRQITPFYGAYLQAQRVALQTLSGRGVSPTQRKQALMTLSATATQMMVFAFLYNMLNDGGDEDKDKPKRSPAEADSRLYFPGTDQTVGLPLRKDWTLLPHVVATHAYKALYKNTEDPKAAQTAVKDAALSAVSGAPLMPTVFKAPIEIALNLDMHTGRDIVGKHFEGLETDQIFTKSSSELGKLIGRTGVMNAINFDHLINGFLGYVGTALLAVTNAGFRHFADMPYADQEPQDWIRSNIPGATSFVSKSEPAGDTTEFYDLLKDSTNSIKSMNAYGAVNPQKAEQYAKEKGPLVSDALSSNLNAIKKQLADIAKYETYIMSQPNDKMSPVDKHKELMRMQQTRQTILTHEARPLRDVYRH